MKNIKKVLTFVVFCCILLLMVDFVRFPECYLTTWRYQLQQDIANGNKEAIDYYNNNYIANNKFLFKEDM